MREAGNGAAKTPRRSQCTDRSAELGAWPLGDPMLSNWFLRGGVTAACKRVPLGSVKGFMAFHATCLSAEADSVARLLLTERRGRKATSLGH